MVLYECYNCGWKINNKSKMTNHLNRMPHLGVYQFSFVQLLQKLYNIFNNIIIAKYMW